MLKPNAILVSVDYTDLLRLTLPRNRHHFDKVLVVTSTENYEHVRAVARPCGALVYGTNAFYEQGAQFNKWLALEEGLDALGRRGWLCVMDADVVWPGVLPDFQLRRGCLYAPYRRMMNDLADLSVGGLPPEERWLEYLRHPNVGEFAGYSQIFHAGDPVLGDPPWHEVDWRHAGGADSYFQARWPTDRKVRLPFEVLHLGPAGVNWCGRATPYVGGGCHEDAAARARQTRAYVSGRARRAGTDRHGHERLQG